jgi:hypothetical protein
MTKIFDYFKRKYSKILIWLFLPVVTITNFSHHKWVNPESVIEWDVKSYYAYLPALFIHQDLKLDFISENPKEYNKWFWPVVTETGNKCIVTSMGMSFLYSPFFFIAHIIAKSTDFKADGYSVPYAFMIHFSALFYLILGLLYLRKLLIRYFNQLTTTLTILMVFVGTNLFYYTAYAAPMAHSYGFSLISIFLFYIDKWHDKPTIRYTIGLGLLSGLITLIRPTNILILLVFFLWRTKSFKDVVTRIRFFIKKYPLVLLMAFSFFLVWVPQFLYWKMVSGKFLYFSYGGIDGSFYWLNPQIKNILISFRKGWWLYTPLMFVATLGTYLLLRKMKDFFLPVIIFLVVNIYVQSSWWCWWFGGSFGLRAFIDSYGIMAIPLALVIKETIDGGKKYYPVLGILFFLTWYNTFQIKQLNHSALHYWWMSKTAYFKQFMKYKTSSGYWEAIPLPDYDKARRGVYVAKNLIVREDNYNNIKIYPQEILKEILQSIQEKPKHHRYAKRHHISVDSAMVIDAWNQYELRWSVKSYVRPIIIEKMTDSLMTDSIFLSHNFPDWHLQDSLDLRKQLKVYSNKVLKKEGF